MKNADFQSAREFAKRGIKSENAIRRDIASGRVPGFYTGNRFIIYSTAYIEQIQSECLCNSKTLGSERRGEGLQNG